MGAQGPEIFDDDVAMDVRDVFEDALAEGCSVRTATRRVLEELADALDDDEDRPLIWLALATLQIEQGAVEARVRRHAVAAIEGRDGLDKWEDSDDEDLRAERRLVLARLKDQLVAVPPVTAH